MFGKTYIVSNFAKNRATRKHFQDIAHEPVILFIATFSPPHIMKKGTLWSLSPSIGDTTFKILCLLSSFYYFLPSRFKYVHIASY
jgi:hypothetical protein